MCKGKTNTCQFFFYFFYAPSPNRPNRRSTSLKLSQCIELFQRSATCLKDDRARNRLHVDWDRTTGTGSNYFGHNSGNHTLSCKNVKKTKTIIVVEIIFLWQVNLPLVIFLSYQSRLTFIDYLVSQYDFCFVYVFLIIHVHFLPI